MDAPSAQNAVLCCAHVTPFMTCVTLSFGRFTTGKPHEVVEEIGPQGVKGFGDCRRGLPQGATVLLPDGPVNLGGRAGAVLSVWATGRGRGGAIRTEKSLCTSDGPLISGSLFIISVSPRGTFFWFWVGSAPPPPLPVWISTSLGHASKRRHGEDPNADWTVGSIPFGGPFISNRIPPDYTPFF